MKKGGLKKRVSVVPDPDYPFFPVKRRTVTTTLTLPGADAEAVAPFQAAALEFNIPNRIAAAQQRLPQVVGVPEHDAAAAWLRRAEACWNDAQNPSLPLALRDRAAGTAEGGGALEALEQFDREMRDGLLRRAIVPSLKRDARRQAGTRQPRRPEVNEWIARQIDKRSRETRDELWERAPGWITDQIGLDSFKKRVSKVRASRK